MPKLPGPGLARTARSPFYVQKTLYRSQDARLREAFASADLVSEGAVKDRTYYGSTSILLAVPREERQHAADVARECVHVRLRAVRLARREAEVRSHGALGVSRCEVKIVPSSDGLRIDVDLEAPLLRKSEMRHAR